jgi:hypothetical protein
MAGIDLRADVNKPDLCEIYVFYQIPARLRSLERPPPATGAEQLLARVVNEALSRCDGPILPDLTLRPAAGVAFRYPKPAFVR